MRKINGKVSDGSVSIEGPKIQIGKGSAISSDLFSYLDGITGYYIFTVQGNLWSTSRLSNNRRGGYKRLCLEGN